MRIEETTAQLDGLMQMMKPDIDSGREPDAQSAEMFAELLAAFLVEEPIEAFGWLQDSFVATDPVRERAEKLIDNGIVTPATTFRDAAKILEADGR